MHNDDHIVALYFLRDKSAIDITKKEYGDYCKSIAANILGSADAAEDCLNDIMRDVWNSIPPEKPSNLKNFIGRTARITAYREWQKRRFDVKGGVLPALYTDELDQILSAHDDSEPEELAKRISAFLRTQNDKDRNIFICRYWYLESIESLCKRFHTTESKIRASLLKTKKGLKTYLEDCH